MPGHPQLLRLIETVARLRAPGGCPWDREQTERSMAPHLLEESYEAVEALQQGVPAAECEELGDVLMNAFMIAQIAAEHGRYDLEQVAAGIADKLIRRHPHVFGAARAENQEQVLAQWERIKLEEQAGRPAAKGLLDGLPRDLPALLRAFRIGEKAARVGFDWPDANGPRAKIDEELRELDEAIAGGDRGHSESEAGDLLFAVVNLCRHRGVNPELALRATNEKFVQRFRHVEQALGKELGTASLARMDALWHEAKAAEKKA